MDKGSKVNGDGSGILIILDADDSTACAAPVRWAAVELRDALAQRGIPAGISTNEAEQAGTREKILVTSAASRKGKAFLAGAGVTMPGSRESIGLIRAGAGQGRALAALGADVRGLAYALLELADRVRYGDEPLRELRRLRAYVKEPATPIRSVTRLFVSEGEDKSWFYDKSFWEKYLSTLISQRFNRFHLTLGLGYDYPKKVQDSYFYFPYPFLLDVPGYKVRAAGLPDEERERNLAMLQWIVQETTRRGLHFQMGLWNHAYDFEDSPNVNYPITGLTPETHGPYCRDALRLLLAACPDIQGVSFRCHSESGLPEGSYDFWKDLFNGTTGIGRKIEIDIHSKGIEHSLVEMALATGNLVNLSPKRWAEHTGLPYQQAAIRELERSVPAGEEHIIEVARRFTRYSFADYLTEDRKYGVWYRIWPGTQRVLLGADPTLIAASARSSVFCGSLGMELTEPLSRKGQRGSGTPGSHVIYKDKSLMPEGRTWEKYLYVYRLWGRLLYDPDAEPESWRRFLRAQFGRAAEDCEAALAAAGGILLLVTQAHLPSANVHIYWPEVYTNLPIVDPERPHPYADTQRPKRFTNVSPLDPAIFSSIEELVGELVEGQRGGKYSPLDVARALDDRASRAQQHLQSAREKIADPADPPFRRLALDVAIQADLGRFFAAKLRAGTAFAFHERIGDPASLEQAVAQYRHAKKAWERIVAATTDTYAENLSFGEFPHKRGHWRDRLPAIEADLEDMEALLEHRGEQANGVWGAPGWASKAVVELAGPQPRAPRCAHNPPASFAPGDPVKIELVAREAKRVAGVRIHYRHVNQAERYEVAEMVPTQQGFVHTISGAYTRSPYPLCYFFELKGTRGHGWLCPGLGPDWCGQPYFVVRQV